MYFCYFLQKIGLTFHANCLLRRQFAWNIKSYFLKKKRGLAFHANCLLRRQFVWNLKSYFLQKYTRTKKKGWVHSICNKYTRYWRASQCCITQVGALSEGFIFFLIIITENWMKLLNLFNKDGRLYKNKKNECNITLNTLKLSVNVTRHFFFVLVYNQFVVCWIVLESDKG